MVCSHQELCCIQLNMGRRCQDPRHIWASYSSTFDSAITWVRGQPKEAQKASKPILHRSRKKEYLCHPAPLSFDIMVVRLVIKVLPSLEHTNSRASLAHWAGQVEVTMKVCLAKRPASSRHDPTCGQRKRLHLSHIHICNTT